MRIRAFLLNFGLKLCLMNVFISSIWAADIHHIRVSSHSQETRIVLESNESLFYKMLALKQPDRLVLDISDATLKTNIPKEMLAATAIQNIRYDQNLQGNLRLVFDLKSPQKVKIFTLSVEKQYRLVIDFSSEIPVETISTSSPSTPVQKPISVSRPTLPETPLMNTAPPVSIQSTFVPSINHKISEQPLYKEEEPLYTKTELDKKNKKRPVVVVIDAGHGGHDSGAIGPGGTFEKNVVLKISLALANEINKQAGMQAVLTRDSDYFIPLRDRLRLARKGKADMFIAIHADAYKLPNSSGASVFALSSKGASSEAARWLAEKENYSELGGAAIPVKNPLLFSVLLDLSQTGTIRESLKLGEDILQEFSKITKLHHNSVEQAPFMVLKSPDIPSLLIETGFISNPYEEERLNDPDYQIQLAKAMLVGIRHYFVLNPPLNSFFST